MQVRKTQGGLNCVFFFFF